MPDLNEIQLNPVARPTDQFETPEVRRKLPGYQLGQLAQSLSKVSGDMQEVSDRYGQAVMQNSRIAASADVARLGVKNMADLKQAVNDGKIQKTDNPWYMVQARQDAARLEAMQAKQDVFAAYDQSGLKNSDNPAQVQSFLTNGFSKYLHGKDAFEVQAMAPALDNARQSLMNYHIELRRQAREDAMHSTKSALWLKTVDAYTPDMAEGIAKGDPDAVARFDALANTLQSELQYAGQVMPFTEANKWMSETLRQAGLIHLDAGMVRQIMDKITTTGGAKLSQTAENREMLAQLPREVLELKTRKESAEEQLHELRVKRDYHALFDLANEKAKAFGGDFKKVSFTEDELAKISPEAKDEWMRAQAAYAQNQLNLKNARDTETVQPLRETLYQETLSGKMTPDRRNDLLTSAIKLGVVGQEVVDRYEYFLRAHRMGTFIWGDSKPETVVSLNESLYNGTLTPEHLLNLAASKDISEADFYRYLEKVSENKFGLGAGSGGGIGGIRGHGGTSGDLGRIEQLLAFGFTDPKLKTGIDYKDLNENRDFRQSLAAAQNEFDDILREKAKDPKWNALSLDAKRETINKIIDTVSTSRGGVDYKTLQSFNQKFNATAKVNEQPKAATTQPTAAPAKPAEQPVTIPGKAGEIVTKADKVLATPIDTSTLKDVLSAPLVASNVELSSDPSFYGHYQSGVSGSLSKLFSQATWETDNLHQLMNARQRYATSTFYRYYSGGVQVDEQSVADNNELRMGMAAMKRLQELKPVAEVADKQLSEMLAAHKGAPSVSLQDKARIAELASYSYEYRMLRRQVGFTPDEVKKAGTDAWRHMPMFINDLDIRQRGPAVLQKLGITDEQDRVAFYKYQSKLTQLMRRQDDVQGPD